MDIKTAFLNGVIEEEVYIEQLDDFETHEQKTLSESLEKRRDNISNLRGIKPWFHRLGNLLVSGKQLSTKHG